MKLMERCFPKIHETFRSSKYSEPTPILIRLICAYSMFQDFDGLFDGVMQQGHFLEISRDARLEMKKKNTIVERWPMRLGENATEKDFNILSSSGHTGCERYVEWKSID